MKQSSTKSEFYIVVEATSEQLPLLLGDIQSIKSSRVDRIMAFEESESSYHIYITFD